MEVQLGAVWNEGLAPAKTLPRHTSGGVCTPQSWLRELLPRRELRDLERVEVRLLEPRPREREDPLLLDRDRMLDIPFRALVGIANSLLRVMVKERSILPADADASIESHVHSSEEDAAPAAASKTSPSEISVSFLSAAPSSSRVSCNSSATSELPSFSAMARAVP
jgi:hypothetical protein